MQFNGSTPLTDVWHAAQLFSKFACAAERAPGDAICCQVATRLNADSRPMRCLPPRDTSAFLSSFSFFLLRQRQIVEGPVMLEKFNLDRRPMGLYPITDFRRRVAADKIENAVVILFLE